MSQDISIKGVARKFGGISQGFSVRDAIFGGRISGAKSLHAALSSMARREHYRDCSECDGKYKWTAGFTQTWTHIHVDICIVTEDQVQTVQPIVEKGLSQAQLGQLVSVWQPAIEDAWSNLWSCSRPGELPCRLTFSVFFYTPHRTSVETIHGHLGLCLGHHEVVVLNRSGRSNKATWYLGSIFFSAAGKGEGPAHEFGHMLGLADENPERDCPDRTVEKTIMGLGFTQIGNPDIDQTSIVPARLMSSFADNIGSNVVPN